MFLPIFDDIDEEKEMRERKRNEEKERKIRRTTNKTECKKVISVDGRKWARHGLAWLALRLKPSKQSRGYDKEAFAFSMPCTCSLSLLLACK